MPRSHVYNVYTSRPKVSSCKTYECADDIQSLFCPVEVTHPYRTVPRHVKHKIMY